MPLTDYHEFAIKCAVKDAEMGIEFAELENDLGNGYYAQILFGSENGQRDWRLTLPTLSGSADRTVTGINGETLTHEAYLWELFCEQKATGVPFALQDFRTGNYYIVRFVDKKLTYARMLTKLYSTGIELKQWRLPGEYVYDPTTIDGVFAVYDGSVEFPRGWAEPAGTFGVENLAGTLGEANDLEFSDLIWDEVSDVTQVAYGDLEVLRFSATTNDGFLLSNTVDQVVREAFLVMKMREATFSNHAGVLTGPDTSFDPALVGQSGTTKFTNLGFGSGFEYRKNGVLFTEADQQAPMNEMGIVHIRYSTGWTFEKIQFGKDRDIAGRFAEMDLAESLLFENLQPKNVRREIYEYLATKWNIGL